MSQARYSLFQTLIRKFAPTPLGAWFFARSASLLDRMYFKACGGRRHLSSIVAGLPVMIMATQGARSGLPRKTPLVYIRDLIDANRIAVIATNFGQHHIPGWYYNLKAYPQASCTLDGKTRTYLAHEASGEEYERFWRYAVSTFGGYESYKQLAGRRIPIMVLTPQENPSVLGS